MSSPGVMDDSTTGTDASLPDIQILWAESLGVRGLGCYVKVGRRNILIDPGFALGYIRHGRLPHPRQVMLAEEARRQSLALWAAATDIVFSHFHGDHVPLVDANPYQLDVAEVAGLNDGVRIWRKNRCHLSPREATREIALQEALGVELLSGETVVHGPLRFSDAVPHGDPAVTKETVMMTLVEGGRKFLHAPDIQLLDDQTVSRILDWGPDIVLAGGPPLYLSRLSKTQVATAWRNALRLARGVGSLVLDHHLMRSCEGLVWLEKLSTAAGRPVLCAADFMGRNRALLEAERENLYRRFPVAAGWHEEYTAGKATTRRYGPG